MLAEENQQKENEILRLKDVVEDKIISVAPTYTNCNIQNNQNNNKNLNFSIKFAVAYKERYDHIPNDEVMHILDQKEFTKSLRDLVDTVAFNPKAPENMTWCVNDKTAEYGALEYNFESNTIVRGKANDVITKKLQAIIFGMSDIFEDLRNDDKHPFNEQQNKNYLRYFNMIGQDDFRKEEIDTIKICAYDRRNLPKVVWERFNIGIEANKLNPRIKIKTI